MGDDRQGWHWGKDIIVDQSSGDLDPEGGGLEPSYDVLNGIWEGLRKAGWRAREVLMLGFGQGGCVALGYVAGAAHREEEFGGVVCIGGNLPGSLMSAPANGSATSLESDVKKVTNGKSPTPVLLLGGSRSTAVTQCAIAETKAKFGSVQYVKWDKTEDSMPRSREEMLPIMRFFARRLRSGAGVPEGAVEVR
jgi:predicted esterase